MSSSRRSGVRCEQELAERRHGLDRGRGPSPWKGAWRTTGMCWKRIRNRKVGGRSGLLDERAPLRRFEKRAVVWSGVATRQLPPVRFAALRSVDM